MDQEGVSTNHEVVDRCPLCGSDGGRHALFEEHAWERGLLRYQICENCGLVFQSPRMDEGQLASFYASGYRTLVQGTEEPTLKDRRVQGARARHLVAFSRPHLQGVNRHLDIGSSTGALLEAFRAAFACQAFGVEPGEVYRRWSRNRGLEVFPDLGEVEESYGKAFDLVSMSHVLEHLPDPVAYLRRLRERVLSPAGHLLVEVPNLFIHRSAEPSHLFLFTSKTLRQVFEVAGFEVVAVRVHGEPRSPVLGLYITALGRVQGGGKGPKPLRFSGRGVRVRRRMGMRIHSWMSRLFRRWVWKDLPPLEEASMAEDEGSVTKR